MVAGVVQGVRNALQGGSVPRAVTMAGPASAGIAASGFQGFARAMTTNEIVYAAVKLISTSAAEPKITGRRWNRTASQIRAERRNLAAMDLSPRAIEARLVQNGTMDELPGHPLVRLLNNPNPFRSRGQLWGTVVMDRLLAGNAYLLKAKGGLGQTAELWRLRPDRVRIVPDRQTFIAGYEYKVGQESVFYPADQVMHFKDLANPMDDYYGLPPLLAGAARIDIDHYMKSFLKSFYEKSGAGPGAILTVKSKMDDDDKTELAASYRRKLSGPANAHELLILDNTESSYTQLGLDRGLRDALPKELDALTEARLAMLFGIPGSILGLLIGYESSSYANKRQDWQVLWDVTMTPLMSDLDDVLNLSIVPEFGGIDEVYFDLSGVRALQEDEDALQERARKNYQLGLLGWNEARSRIGAGDLAEDDHLLLPPGQVLTPVEDALAPAVAVTGEVQAQALNGAQISAVLVILQEVTAGTLAPDAAKGMLKMGFPSLEQAEIDRMVDAAAAFKPETSPVSAPEQAAAVNLLEGVATGVREAQRGRPPLLVDQEARAVYERAEALRRDMPSITMAQIASRMGISERTYRRYRAEFGKATVE